MFVIKEKLLVILLTIFLFTPQFIFFGFVFKTIYISFIVIAIYEFIINGINKQIFNLIFFIMISLIFILVTKIYFGNYDVFPIDQLIIAPFILLASSFIIRIYIKTYAKGWLEKLVNDLLLSLLINSSVIYISVLSEEVRLFLYKHIYVTEKAERYLFGNEVDTLRFPGITVSGFSYLSVLYSFILLNALIFYWKHSKTEKLNNILLKFVFCTASLIFVARTGLYISIVITMLLIFLILYRSDLKKISTILFILFFIPVLFVKYYIYIDHYLNFAFEIFLNLYNGDGLKSTTTEALINDQLFFDLNNILMGSGNFGRGDNYIDSDIGWVLFYSGSGLIGTLIIYSPLIYMAVASYFNSCLFFLKYSIPLMIVMLFFLNFKDIYYIGHGYIQPVFLFYCAVMSLSKNEKS